MSNLSKSLENLLERTYQDNKVSMHEFFALAKEADRRWDIVIDQVSPHATLIAFQNAMDVAMHLLYLSVRDIRDEELSDTGEAIVKDAVLAQVEYLRAGAEFHLNMLKVGPNRP